MKGWKRRLKFLLLPSLRALVAWLVRRFSLPLLLEGVGGRGGERFELALTMEEMARLEMRAVLQMQHDWSVFLAQGPTEGSSVLLLSAADDPWQGLMLRLLQQRHCVVTPVYLRHLPANLSEAQHFDYFSTGQDWQVECFPKSGRFDWLVATPVLAQLYWRPALLQWLVEHYGCRQFLLRLPRLGGGVAAGWRRLLGKPVSGSERVLYSEDSVRLEFGSCCRVEWLAAQENLDELHCRLQWCEKPFARHGADGEAPLVSVIVPVYNIESYLRRCLDSVMAQSLESWELIAVNDCSSDGSEAILRDYQQRDRRVRYLNHEKNLGLSASRNRAMAQAQGRYIFFLDGDDYLHRDALRACSYLAEESGAAVLLQETAHYPVTHPRVGCYLWHHPRPGEGFLPLENPYFSPSVSNLYRRSMLERYQLRFVEGGLYEDAFFSYQLSCRGEKFLSAPLSVFYYYRRPGSISYSPLTTHHIKSYAWSMQQIKRDMEKRGLAMEVEQQQRYLLILHRYWAMWLGRPMLGRIAQSRNYQLLRYFWQENRLLFDTPACQPLAALLQRCEGESSPRRLWELLRQLGAELAGLAPELKPLDCFRPY